MRQLAPHRFHPEVKVFSGIPLIRISTKAFKKMNYYIRLSAEILQEQRRYGRESCFVDEISWLGSVQKQGNRYYIEDVFLFEQKVSTGFFEFMPGSIAKFATDLLKREEKSIVNSLFFWGHVHLGSTFPSILDDEQMEVFSYNDFMIRGIADRQGHLEFSVFEYKEGRVFYDVPWELWDPEDEELKSEIRKEIKEKIHKKVRLPKTNLDT